MKGFFVFSSVAVVVFILKLSISTLGYNNDIEIWKHVSRGMLDGFLNGRVIYTYTQFYNHGPIRSYALYFLAFALNILSLNDMYTFHIWVVFFLSIFDTIMALLIWKIFGKVSSLIYLLNPVSLLITGYHSQIESTTIMIGLLSWFVLLKAKDLYEKKNPKYKKLLIASAIILGFSLGIKHVLFFFPFYVFLMHRRNKIFKTSDIITYIFIPYFIFFGLFGIEILRDSYHPAAITFRNIKMFVFDYRSGGLYGTSGFAQLLHLFLPAAYIQKYFSWTPFFKDYSFFFVTSLLLFGVLAINKVKDIKIVYPLYLLAMFAFSPSLANQYMAVPLLAMSVFYKNIIAFIYFLNTYIYLAAGPSANISGLVRYQMNLLIGNIKVPFFPWSMSTQHQDKYSQVWAILLAILLLYQMYYTPTRKQVVNIIKNYL